MKEPAYFFLKKKATLPPWQKPAALEASETLNVVRNKNNFESIKICLFVAAYMETNYDEYLNLYYRKEKASKQYEYTSRIEKEVEIINQTIKSIQTDHSDWYVE